MIFFFTIYLYIWFQIIWLWGFFFSFFCNFLFSIFFIGSTFLKEYIDLLFQIGILPLNLSFLIFLFFILCAVCLMIFTPKPITGLLALIVVVIQYCIFWIVLDFQFLGFVFLMVYVGAIAILFLFALILIDLQQLNTILQNMEKYSPKSKNNFFIPTFSKNISLIFYIICCFFFLFIFLNILFYFFLKSYTHLFFDTTIISPTYLDYHLNIKYVETVGYKFYTDYSYYFLLSGIILFLGMVGPIMLTSQNKLSSTFLNKQHLNLFAPSRSYLLNLIRKKKF